MSEKRELLMLAQKYDPAKHDPSGMFVSIKCDGMRCWWDGGVSRGVPKALVPWANNAKDERYREPPIATGLWSRYGNVIHAPDWFLNGLPKSVMLDGELYLGRGLFQATMSIAKDIVPGSDWKRLKLLVFDTPSVEQIFRNGRINNPQYKEKIIDSVKCQQFVLSRDKEVGLTFNQPRQFQFMYNELVQLWYRCGTPLTWRPLTQLQLSMTRAKANAELDRFLIEETEKGGEGLMLRVPWSYWTPTRSNDLLKVKKLDDDEGIVMGCVTGKEGKLLGLMGALIVKLASGKTFELSGFTDAERQLIAEHDDPATGVRAARDWASRHPGLECPKYITPVQFPLGSVVRFRHRGFTDDQLPREARFWR